MTRNLYRLYLYTVFIALFIFAVTATSRLLSTLFALTALRGDYAPVPTQSEVVQSLVFAIVGWIISGALGGLHYWLIRRDMRQDPAAATSAIRAFFLNLTIGFALLFSVVLIGFFVLESWARNSSSGISGSLGAALATLIMVVVLELERRRTSVQAGVAMVFQRLHFFGVQLVLLSYLAIAFLNDLRPLIDGIFFQGQGNQALCTDPGYTCQSHNPIGLGLTILWFTLWWLAYSLITRNDSSRNTRIVLHGVSLAFGISYILYGLDRVLELAFRPLFGVSVRLEDVLAFNAHYDFFSPLLLGIVVTLVYHLLLTDLSRRNLMSLSVRRLSEWTIAGILLAGAFWWGIGYGLYSLFQTISPTSGGSVNQVWATTLALLITGLSYIPLDLYLLRRYRQDPADAMGPRRGFVLSLLGGGILALAIGGSVALYTWGTALLGSPTANWSETAQQGLAATLVGAAIIGIYLWATLREHLITRGTQHGPSPAPAPAAPASIESILDDLLAGRISRDEAARLLHALQTSTALLLV